MPSASRCCPYRSFKVGGHLRSGQLLRAGPKQAIVLHAAAPGPARWSRGAVIPSPRFKRAAIAAPAAFAVIWAVTWPGMVSARAQAPTGFSRTSASGSFLAARHAGGQKDAAAAAAYYRAALRGDPRNGELLGRTFLAVLAN